MAEQSDLERTEPASQRRLEQAREEGHVPQSRELTTFLVMMTGASGIWVTGRWVGERLTGVMRHGLTLDRRAAFDPQAMGTSLVALAGDALLTLLPLFGILLLAVFAGPFMMGGWVFSPRAARLDLTRLDPIKGFARVVSLHGLVELVKALAKAGVVGGVAWWVTLKEQDRLFALVSQPLASGIGSFVELVLFSTVMIVGGMALIAAVDVPFQLWHYHSRLRMTKEEARQEAKELEGDPQVKGRIRQQQREIARRRMMAQVPKADVVVTNPTHFSVALKYDARKMRAPRVVAKGRGELALRIREIAAAHAVPLLEVPSLARALYAHTELDDEVPTALYTAVAEVMAYVYALGRYLEQGGQAPELPSAVAVPADMDPGAAE